MKLLHIADLHLGRSLHEQGLEEDQAFILKRIEDEAIARKVDALIVCGDVWDRSLPSAEAVKLLGDFLAALKARNPQLPIALISGNHDSAERLGYARDLFSSLGIHIGFKAEDAFTPIWLQGKAERAALFLLPFLPPACLSDGEGRLLRSQAELAQEAARRLDSAREAAMREGADATILAAHLFANGGTQSESERVFLGTAELVDIQLFKNFSYVALGHLHRHQRIAANAWYAGSPLAYSFDEAGQQKVALEIGVGSDAQEDGSPSVTPVPLEPLRRVTRKTGSFASFCADDGSCDSFRGDYLECVLDNRELVDNPLMLLRAHFPRILSVRQDAAMERQTGTARAPAPLLAGSRRDLASDFRDFLTDVRGEADADTIELFGELAQEAERASAEA